MIYTIASVRAGRWLVPAFHAAIDAHIRNGHDDPLNFNVQSFANSLDGLMQQLQGPKAAQPEAVAKANTDSAPGPNSRRPLRRRQPTLTFRLKPLLSKAKTHRNDRPRLRPKASRLPRARPRSPSTPRYKGWTSVTPSIAERSLLKAIAGPFAGLMLPNAAHT